MTGHARAGILSRLAGKFPGHRPNPGHLGGYEGDLIQEPGTEDEQADQTLTWRPGNGAPAETRQEQAVILAASATDPAEAWYGYVGTTVFDNFPPQQGRPYSPETEPEPAPRPRIWPLPPELPRHMGPRAAQVVAMLKAVRYPGCYGSNTPEDYAATMRVWSRLTGTASPQESPGAWLRPAIEPPAPPEPEPLPALPGFRVAEQMAANLLPGGILL